MKSVFSTILFLMVFYSGSQNTSMTEAEYLEKGTYIWQTFVPASGQAKFVQGELLRAIEKLRDEAQRNGHINFNEKCHQMLIQYLKENLLDRNVFDVHTIEQIEQDLKRIGLKNQPYTGDDLYNRINDRIIDWFMFYGMHVKHQKNSDLKC